MSLELSTLASLLPLRGVVVTLRCLEPTTLNFFHQPALTAFLRFLAGSPEHYDQLIRLDAPESGRVQYRAGDYYRFALYGLAGSETLLDTLLQQLAHLPDSAPKQDAILPFRNNWQLQAIQDVWSGETVHSLIELSTYDLATLQAEAQLWQHVQHLHWQWVAPVRLLKAKEQRSTRKMPDDEQFVRDASEASGSLILSRGHNAISDLLRRRQASSTALASLPEATLTQAHWFWVEVRYRGENSSAKSMNGALGQFKLVLPQGLSAEWWVLLILGQYLGIGQRTAFGWGRYVLTTTDGLHSYRRVYPAHSLLVLAQEPTNLIAAWAHVTQGEDLTELEELAHEWQDPDEAVLAHATSDDEPPITALQECLEKLLWGQYSVPTLRGYLIPKPQGGVRALAIPPLWDRILQRAVQQVLNQALEPLFSEVSHGYRKGFSRLTASQTIQKAWQAGFQWVYEGDIRDFFDSVSWLRLEQRLQALFSNDPIIPAILAWMKAPVVFQGETIVRQAGLPQGSSLSPVLANLLLDDFDHDMEAAGFRLIRFADDFVVLCRSPEEAQQAAERARLSLEEHGLALHPDKQAITHRADGFRYLGYLFVNDLVLDVGGKKGEVLDATTLPTASWAAQLTERQAIQARSEQSLQAIIERLEQQQPLQGGERSQGGVFITITGEQPCVLSTALDQLQVQRKDQVLLRTPWRQIETVLIIGNHQVTTQAMHEALAQGINIHFATTGGDYQGVLTHQNTSQHHSVWLQQVLTFQDPAKALYCARTIMSARLKHMKEVLRHRQLVASIPVLENAIRKAGQAESLEQLLGFEGSATREYYAKIASILPSEWQFNERNRRPPRDPFNVLLSLGYTQLYAIVETVVITKGLLPWQGFYHQPRGRHAVLASDLMEPFRHFVERHALSMVLRGELAVSDFTMTSAGACLMSDTARRKYMALLLQQWEVKSTALGQTEPLTWLEHVQKQAQALKDFITKGETFHAFRLR